MVFSVVILVQLYLFVRAITYGSVILLLYVDYMILMGDDIVGISDLKIYLQCEL